MSKASAPLAVTNLQVTWWIFAIAFGFLAAGLGLYFWVLRRPRARFQHGTNVLVWFLVAFTPTVLLFSLFPDSQVEGGVAGFTFTGALGALVAIWWIGIREGGKGLRADQEVEGLRREIRALRGEKATGGWGKRGPEDDPPLVDQSELRYRVDCTRKKELVILTGNILDVKQADVWVSSENTNMQMARYHDRSISGMIRFYGARRDGEDDPVDDVIADELKAIMLDRGKRAVSPAAVLVTSAGQLTARNRVKRIYHVASVQGQGGGAGYRAISEMGRCVTSALERATDRGDAKSILFPLLGTGVAGSAAGEVAEQMVEAAAKYLADHPGAPIRIVYFLAYRRSDLHHWERAAESCRLLEPLGGSAEQYIDAVTADRSEARNGH
jgi:O-acetyl-ADP-ribose deacetylase (regulator of RNase III)